MLKDILETLLSRYLIAILNFALIFVNAHVLGIEGVGAIGLIWASISINVTINGIFSGNTLVYFLGRYSVRFLYPVAVGWTFVGSALGCSLMHLAGLLPEGYGWHIYGLTVLYSINVAHARFLLGKDHIRGFNLASLLQGGLLFFVLLCFYYVARHREVMSYVWGLYLTNGIAFAVSLFFLLPFLGKHGKPEAESKSLYPVLREMFVYGLWGSADNLAEICTTRLNYFLVERFAGLGGVGLLDAGTKISESVWNISRSVAYIEYSRIAKTKNKSRQKQITLQLFKLTLLALSAVMACILLIPERVYTGYLFGQEFEGIQNIITILSPGIIALGCNTLLSHYFIGSGKIKYSAAASCTGLITLLAAGSLLIPAYGITGSTLSTSIASGAMLLFSLTVFIRQTQSRFHDFLPRKSDFRQHGK